MLEKFLTIIAKKAYPDRDISVEKIGKNFFLHTDDNIGCNNYLLDGKYSYDEVVALNQLTGYYCGFGFCNELGPVAFIGVCNSHLCNTSGYFEHVVHEYGTLINKNEYYFEVYSAEVAKKIINYTVYGSFGLKDVATKATVEKMNYIHDSRYKRKKNMGYNKEKKIIEMDIKLPGTYSFYDARLLATGTTKDKDSFSAEEYPIQFAVVDGNQYVGIINLLCEHRNDFKFREVWEYGDEEPKLQEIRFLSKREAKKINKFNLYVYAYPTDLKTKTFPIEKEDKSFDKRFTFHLPNGTDYRLI